MADFDAQRDDRHRLSCLYSNEGIITPMSDKRHFILQPEPHPSRKLACAACMTMPAGYHVRIEPPVKKREQEEK